MPLMSLPNPEILPVHGILLHALSPEEQVACGDAGFDIAKGSPEWFTPRLIIGAGPDSIASVSKDRATYKYYPLDRQMASVLGVGVKKEETLLLNLRALDTRTGQTIGRLTVAGIYNYNTDTINLSNDPQLQARFEAVFKPMGINHPRI